jgi:putative sigma-54 modulation protein
MRIEFTGRHSEVGPELRALAERKLRKLEKVLHGISDVHVVLESDRHRQKAEVSVRSPRLTLTAADVSSDAGASLATVIEKITRQAQRQMGKRIQRKRRAPARATALWNGVLRPAGERAAGPRVIRTRRFVVKPMTIDEAVLEVGDSEEGVVVFRNARTERVNVLYKRRDGNLGLIEPEG